MGHCTPAPTAPPPLAEDPACPAEHAAMGHCTPAPAAPPPAAEDPACPAEHAAMGHCTPASAAAAPAPRPSPPSALAASGPEHAADTVWDPALMAEKRATKLIAEHGAFIGSNILLDRLEARMQDGADGYAWDAQAWFGGDYDKFWLKSEGEGAFGEAVESVEIQTLYSRALDPWFNLQAGVRYDLRPRPDRAHLVLGVEGLAPYWFEVDAALFLSDRGDLSARLEAEYDQRLTNRLILQPSVELEIAAQKVPELGLGAGLSSIEAGLRLRYEFEPEYAPYVGVEYHRSLGDSARYSRASGEEAGGWALLLGLRAWF